MPFTLKTGRLPRSSCPPDFISKYYLDYIGFTLDEALDWGWSKAIHPDDIEGVFAHWQNTRASRQPADIEARLRRYDGQYRWFVFRANPLRDAHGNIVKWYGVNTDIHDRRETELRLRRSEAFLAEGQHLAGMGNLSWRVPTGEITWSDQLYRIFEFEPGTEVTLDRIAARVPADDVPMMLDMVARAERGESNFEYQHRIAFPDGRTKVLHLIAHRAMDREEIEYIGAVLDITQRRESEEALEKVRSELGAMARVTSLGALTASIAHEVNQPLSGIITNAGTCLRLLSEDPPNISVARETARRTIRDGNRAAGIITRLRSLFKNAERKPEPVDLNEAAREVLALMAGDLRRARVTPRTQFANQLPPARGDRIQFQQVIMNLLRNASEAMKEVDDRVRRLTLLTEPIEGDLVKLSVIDCGLGLEPEATDKIFRAFYTTKDDGMGIGLSVSRSIIESHGGRLWAEANDDAGATFSFVVPEFREGIVSVENVDPASVALS
jgi:hypothetical protein